jgi:hypothetical protein
MFNATDIKEHEVIGSNGKHVGTVDHLDGARIKYEIRQQDGNTIASASTPSTRWTATG